MHPSQMRKLRDIKENCLAQGHTATREGEENKYTSSKASEPCDKFRVRVPEYAGDPKFTFIIFKINYIDV